MSNIENDNKESKEKITKRADDFSRWYLDVIAAADMADYAPVKGCMVIKPYGYAIWENFQKVLDGKFKATGHKNAYFPIFIPESFLKREAEHVEGFSPELAVVTHAGGKKLEENLVVRPTSETIIYDSFAKWIHSWRDLPLLINQWANVVRWELRTRLFLRTTEFLWQEGHTAHATHEEAQEETLRMLEVYRQFMEDYLAIPVIQGVKSDTEKFAGALKTLSIEALMQDKKSLQCGTSHDLGQNFAKVFDVKFLDNKGNEQYVWQTSWGVSTRLIGALIMVHGDDKGIIVPPHIAPTHLAFVPIWKSDEEKTRTMEAAKRLADTLPHLSSEIDSRDIRPAWKYYEWERKGVPLRVEIGPRDIENHQAVLVRRDTGEKIFVKEEEFAKRTSEILEAIQQNLFERAKSFREDNIHEANTWDEFQEIIEKQGGFVRTSWCGSVDCESKIKEKTKATVRCIPFQEGEGDGECVYCRKPSHHKPLFAQSY
ncbi:MAG: proline--tRNA ligase [Dehalococcoidales bacterium]|nr:proline--tRNA ligase [Dehalococcoidales bacterium]